jgi:hypothetical protein
VRHTAYCATASKTQEIVGSFSEGIDFATFTTEKNKNKINNMLLMRQKGHYANKLDACQGQTKPERYAVAAVTTNNHEEDDEEEDGHKTLFEFCGCHQEAINKIS